MQTPKVAIIGAGAVGATVAYATAMRNIFSKIILIDVNEDKEEGEVLDLADGLSFMETGTIVRGDFKDAKAADIIVLTAGARQKPGETRLELIQKNVHITKSIFKQIGTLKKDAIVLVISNPVDVLTYLIQDITKLPHGQVFGSGTTLDSARLRTEIGTRLGVHPTNVSGFVIGEHGDTEFVAWSTVSVGGVPLKDLKKIPAPAQRKIEKSVREEAYRIIGKKGATYYGIGITAADILEAIVYNQNKVLPVTARLSAWNGVSGICLGAPAVVGEQGVLRHWPVKLTAGERRALKYSAKTLQSYINQL